MFDVVELPLPTQKIPSPSQLATNDLISLLILPLLFRLPPLGPCFGGVGGGGECSFSSSSKTEKRGVPASPYLANTLTTPSPPPLTTHRPSWLHTTAHAPSPRMMRWDVISCVQLRFSRDQNRREASWPAETSSRPSGDSDRAEMDAGWATMLYVHWPVTGLVSNLAKRGT